jgi:hypothetical protein
VISGDIAVVISTHISNELFDGLGLLVMIGRDRAFS